MTACHKPIWPDNFEPDAYLQLEAPLTVDMPALEGGTLTVAGVWAHPRTLVVDMVIEHPETDEDVPFAVWSATFNAYTSGSPDLPWFVFERDGERVDYAYPPPRTAPLDHTVYPRTPDVQPLVAPEGRRRWGFSAWYPTFHRIPDGQYVIRTRVYESYVDHSGAPPDSLVRMKRYRSGLGLDQLDGAVVMVRDYRLRPDVRSR